MKVSCFSCCFMLVFDFQRCNQSWTKHKEATKRSTNEVKSHQWWNLKIFTPSSSPSSSLSDCPPWPDDFHLLLVNCSSWSGKGSVSGHLLPLCLLVLIFSRCLCWRWIGGAVLDGLPDLLWPPVSSCVHIVRNIPSFVTSNIVLHACLCFPWALHLSLTVHVSLLFCSSWQIQAAEALVSINSLGSICASQLTSALSVWCSRRMCTAIWSPISTKPVSLDANISSCLSAERSGSATGCTMSPVMLCRAVDGKVRLLFYVSLWVDWLLGWLFHWLLAGLSVTIMSLTLHQWHLAEGTMNSYCLE